ncbi:hypothetical protein SS50377_28056 [Spironucleus salmonicida]|uniref:Uncharacterized protein n=1 Tax=Spironucleus salmonicida TaxID=348837 RepID=V6LPF9_9EUKA|nr:hypothetical protein SS50377_28056 [Spironucleus salmonicida]|eukprot:EST42609.1 hypothetical protein SS50377_17928 [Spironucleus salmonicida]
MPPKKKQAVSTRPAFEYLPVLPQQYDRYILLTLKLVSWSYLNFSVRLPVNTPLAHIKKLIIQSHKQALHQRKQYTAHAQIGNFDQPFSVMTEHDYEILSYSVNQDLNLYKGSPLTWPPLPDDDSMTLADIGFNGSCVDEPLIEADLFYDFQACRIIGNGKEKV